MLDNTTNDPDNGKADAPTLKERLAGVATAVAAEEAAFKAAFPPMSPELRAASAKSPVDPASFTAGIENYFTAGIENAAEIANGQDGLPPKTDPGKAQARVAGEAKALQEQYAAAAAAGRIRRTAATSRPRPRCVGVKARLSHGSIEQEESSQCYDRLVGLRRWANEACMLCRH